MALVLSGTNGVVGAGFTLDPSGVSVTAGVGTFTSLQGSAASLTQIPAANIVGVCTSGLTKTGGFGKILQTIMAEKTDVTSFSGGTTRADISGITVNITPSATSSKILIHSTLNFCNRKGGYAFGLYLMRDSTDLAKGDASSSRNRTTIGGWSDYDSNYDMRPLNYVYLDSPNTTSQVTYKWQWNDPYHNQTLYLNSTFGDVDAAYSPRGASNIIVQEIAE